MAGSSMMNEDARKAFGARLAEVRAELGLNKSQMAKKCGLATSTTYNNWELGITSPINSEVIRKVANELGVTERWLRSGTGEKSAKKVEEQKVEAKIEKLDREVFTVNASDVRRLEDIQLVINHLRDLNISRDEKEACYLTLAELRNDIEMNVRLGRRPTKATVSMRADLGL